MQPLINWIPITDLGMPSDVLKNFLIGQRLNHEMIAETWLGTNAFDPTQKFVLQLRPAKPGAKYRRARMRSQSLDEHDQPVPRAISEDHVADAAGFLYWEWFQYLPLEVGSVLLSEEPPPIPGVEVFPGRKR